VPAMAQVTFYGRANVDVSSYQANGAVTAAENIQSRMRVADSGSRFGFRVNEDLGGGMRAFVTCETGINIDNGGANGQGVGVDATFVANPINASTNFFCSRQGHVGVGTALGEVRLGRQNIWWTQGEINQTGANFLSADALGAMYAPSSGLSAAPASRTSNVVLLHAGAGLGAFAGSQAYFVVDTQEGIAASATPLPNKGNIMGVKVNYSAGQIVAMLDYAKVKNSVNDRAAATNFDASGTKVGLGYKYAADSLVSVIYWDLSRTYTLAASHTATPTNVNNLGAAAIGSRSQTGLGINVQHSLGAIDLYAQYGQMASAKNSAGATIGDSGITGTMLGARYKLSKRSSLTGTYVSLKNGVANATNLSGGSYASGNAGLGSDPRVFAFGVMHNF